MLVKKETMRRNFRVLLKKQHAAPNPYSCSHIGLMFLLYICGQSVRPDMARAKQADLNKEARLTAPSTVTVMAREKKNILTSKREETKNAPVKQN